MKAAGLHLGSADIIVGIDLSAREHQVVIVDADGRRLTRRGHLVTVWRLTPAACAARAIRQPSHLRREGTFARPANYFPLVNVAHVDFPLTLLPHLPMPSREEHCDEEESHATVNIVLGT